MYALTLSESESTFKSSKYIVLLYKAHGYVVGTMNIKII